MENLYMPAKAVVEDIKAETPKIRTLSISVKKEQAMSTLPGQFIELTIFGFGEFPVSVSAVLGSDGNRFQTTIQQIGKATSETAKLSPGSIIGIRGPFGNGFRLDAMRGKNVCIVTGGVGLAAVKLLIDYILEHRDQYGELHLLHGAKTPIDLIYKDFIFNKRKAKENKIEILVTVDQPDDSWNQNVGVVTELLKKASVNTNNTVAVVCGPGVMMKFASQHLSEMGFSDDRILLSMERNMHCGVGICGHCAVGLKKVCIDGPIFNYVDAKNSLETFL